MNIFVTHRSPRKCARSLDDKRLGKMVLETAQMLCTVLNLEAEGQVTPYRNSHATSVLVTWAKKPRNWSWLWELGMELGDEYIHRFGKKHASHLVIEGLTFNWPDRCIRGAEPKSWINFAAHRKLGIDFKHLLVRKAYRSYLNARFKTDKLPVKWTKRKRPSWVSY